METCWTYQHALLTFRRSEFKFNDICTITDSLERRQDPAVAVLKDYEVYLAQDSVPGKTASGKCSKPVPAARTSKSRNSSTAEED
jgi:hypothetical protein